MEEHGGDAAPPVTATTSTGDNALQDDGSGNIKIKVSSGSNNFDVFTSPHSTFGDLKQVIAKAIGLDPNVQKLLFRGKEKDDQESLQMAGVKNNAKMILIENSNSNLNSNLPTQNENLQKVENIEEISRGVEAVNQVREQNNQLAEQVSNLETVVCSGTWVADKDFIYLTEMLMRQLLKLDGIDAQGEGRTQRKLEVRRVQGLVEKLDNLRANYSNLASNAQQKAVDEPSLPSASSSKM